METAKLILDYLKVLTWPILVLGLALIFSPDIRKLLADRPITANVGAVSVTVGTGQTKTETPGGKSRPPDVWFTIRDSTMRDGACVTQAQLALQKTGFSGIVAGGVTYGYDEQFVGAVWCSWRENAVLITVAGPHNGLQAKHGELEQAFFAAGGS